MVSVVAHTRGGDTHCVLGSEPIYQASSPPQLTEYAPTVLIEQSARPGTVVLGHSPEAEPPPPRPYVVKAELPSNISQSQPASEPSTAASNSPTENQTPPSVQLEPFFESYNYDSFDAFSAPSYQGNNVQEVAPAGDTTPTDYTGGGGATDWSTATTSPERPNSSTTTTQQGGELYVSLETPYDYSGWSAEMAVDKRRRRFKDEIRDSGGVLGSPKEQKRRLGQSTKTTIQSSGSSGSDGGVGKSGAAGVACCRGVYFDQIRHLWRANWPEESVIIDKATGRMVDIRRCTRTKGFSAKKYGYQDAQRLAIEHREKMTGPGMVRHYVYQDETNPVAQIPGSRSARKRQQQSSTSSPSNQQPQQPPTAIGNAGAGQQALHPQHPQQQQQQQQPPPPGGSSPTGGGMMSLDGAGTDWGATSTAAGGVNAVVTAQPDGMGVYATTTTGYTGGGGEEASGWGTPWATNDGVYGVVVSGEEDPLIPHHHLNPHHHLSHHHLTSLNQNETPTSADTLFAQIPLHMHHLVDGGVLAPL